MSKDQRLKNKSQRVADQERRDEAREQFVAFRLDHEQKARRRRVLMSLGRRLDTALARADVLSDVSTASLDRVARGKPGSSPPAPIKGLLYGKASGSVREVYERRLRILIEGLEHELDAHKIKPLVAELHGELTEEIEARLIRDFEGEPPSVVIFLDPSWTGVRHPVHAVKQARLRHGRNPNDGTKIDG